MLYGDLRRYRGAELRCHLRAKSEEMGETSVQPPKGMAGRRQIACMPNLVAKRSCVAAPNRVKPCPCTRTTGMHVEMMEMPTLLVEEPSERNAAARVKPQARDCDASKPEAVLRAMLCRKESAIP